MAAQEGDLLVVDGPTVRRLLTPALAADAVAEALREVSTGALAQPLRMSVAAADDNGHMLVMPARHPTDGMAVKLLSAFPGNTGLGLPAFTGVIVVFDPETGVARAIMSGAAITEIRTAAVSAVATGLLARPDATRLAIVGTGPQARAHLLAFATLRPWDRVLVSGRTPGRAERLAEWAGAQGIPAAPTDPATAARGADVICTLTSSATPVLDAGDIAEGTHVTAIGAHHPSTRELPGKLVGRADIFVESATAARAEAGDLLLALDEGALDPARPWTEIGDVVAGTHPGRPSATAVTLFKSVGLAVEDLATAVAVYRLAAADGAGTRVALA